jgi:preprotein translocase subunit SecB
MKLQLKKTEVLDLKLGKSIDEPFEDGFSYEVALSEDNSKIVAIVFSLTLETEEKFRLNLKYRAIFETDEDLTEDDMTSHFFSVNAPAIAYPFLRAYIGNLLLNSGMEPILLPSVNFAALVREQA